ncbi:MAG: TIGR04282 family arsenosugar biosynthesis glycosyltransferase [Pseudomonadota bacterium]
MTRRQLVIMAKAPVAGAVKTRLAADLGPGRATALYRVMVASVIASGCSPRWKTVIATGGLRSTFWPRGIARRDQGHGDLGVRMRQIFHNADGVQTIILGTDTIGIGQADIARAFHLLARHDWVFGPALDGGYWLIGHSGRRPISAALNGVTWSAATTLTETINSLPSGQSHGVLEIRQDIDTVHDLASAAPKGIFRIPLQGHTHHVTICSGVADVIASDPLNRKA